jgi:hypothetical protein
MDMGTMERKNFLGLLALGNGLIEVKAQLNGLLSHTDTATVAGARLELAGLAIE